MASEWDKWKDAATRNTVGHTHGATGPTESAGVNGHAKAVEPDRAKATEQQTTKERKLDPSFFTGSG